MNTRAPQTLYRPEPRTASPQFAPLGAPPAAAPPVRRRAQDRRPNWWLRLTSYGWDQRHMSLAQRERVRRSRLASWIILGLLIMELAIMPAGLADTPTLIAAATAFAGTLLAALLNRFGFVNVVGLLLVALVTGAILGAVVSAPKGELDTIYLPAYDLFAITIVLGTSILPRFVAFPIAFANIAIIVLDFSLQPKVGDLTHWLAIEGPVPLVARPIALQIIIAVVAYLWVRSSDEAIRRADRAEELAALEHQLAEQKRQLDVGIQELLATHIRAANGDFSARAPLRQENILWQIASSLNNLLARMQRTAQAEHKLARTEEELRRLAAAIDDARAGRAPFWPMPTGTAADLILERIARDQRRAAAPAGPSQPLDPRGLPGGFGAPAMPSRGMAGSPYAAGYGQAGFPGGPSQPLDPRGFPGGFGAPVPPSVPMGQAPYFPPMQPGAQAPSTPLDQSPFSQAPFGQGPQANDRWPQSIAPEAAGPSGPPSQVPPAPWMLSHEELARDAQDRVKDRSPVLPQDPPPDWPELPPAGEWTIPTNGQ